MPLVLPQRAPVVAHRTGVTAADVLPTPSGITSSAVTEAGSVLTAVARNYSIAAGNRWGTTLPSTPAAITPALNQAVRLTFAGVAGADYYDIFLSTAANPLWVGRITEAQRQAGGIISAVGVYTPPGVGVAGAIDIGIDGTGVAQNAAPFTNNNAWRPDNVAVNLLPFFRFSPATSDWYLKGAFSMGLGNVANAPLLNEGVISIDSIQSVGSAPEMVLCMGNTVAGQGASFDLGVSLYN